MAKSGSSAEPTSVRLRSAIRGRERWEVKALRKSRQAAQALEQTLLRHPTISRVHANPSTGRVLVLYSADGPSPNIGSLIKDWLETHQSDHLLPAPCSNGASPSDITQSLSSLLKTHLHKETIGPALLTVVSHSVHILQGLSFINAVSSTQGNGMGTVQSNGGGRTGSRLNLMTALSMLLTGADIWLQYQRGKAWKKLGQQTQYRLRSQLVDSILTQDMAFFDNYGTGRIVNLVTEDTARVGEFVEKAGDDVIEKVLTILISGAFLVNASPSLALLSCLSLPFVFLTSLGLSGKTAKRYAATTEASSSLSQMLENDFAGIADLKSFTAEEFEAQRLRGADLRLFESALESAASASIQTHVAQSLFYVGFGVTVRYGGQLTIEGKISLGKYIQAAYWFPRLLDALTGLLKVTKLYHSASASAKHLGEILNLKPSIYSGPTRHPPEVRRGQVTFENVDFGYNPGVNVLENVSFQINPGEKLAIVGPTGSGKSTILRLLLRFYDAKGGRILMDGKEIKDLDLQDLRSSVSFVSQDIYLFEGSVEQNVKYGNPTASRDQVVEALHNAGAAEMLRDLPGGLDAQVGEHGRRLSGGERQRVALARALLKEAPILAFDEATSHLDSATETRVRNSLRKVVAGRSMIMIAHSLSNIRDADRIIVLERGKIREVGIHEQLLANNGLYASLWRLQSEDASI